MFRSNKVKGQAQVKAPKQRWKIDLKSLDWRKVTIILAVLAVVVIGAAVTAGFLMRDRDNGPDTEKPLEDMSDEERRRAIEADKKYAISSLTEIYNYRGVKLEHFIDEQKTDDYGGVYTTKSCYRVVGLKDKVIEEKINGEIRAAYDRAVVAYDQSTEKWRRVECYIDANFGGLLSTTIYFNYSESTKLVWRLDTGESPKFNDLFLKGANIPVIIENAAYQWWTHELKMSWCGGGMGGYAVGEGEEQNLWTQKFNGKNENVGECLAYAVSQLDAAEVDRAIYSYKSDPDLEFFVDSSSLEFEINGQNVRLRLESIWDQIALYKRFENSDLIQDAIEFKSFVFAVGPYFSVEREAENLIIARIVEDNIYFSGGGDNTPEKIIARFREIRETVLAEIKDYAAKHSSKMIFVYDPEAFLGCSDRKAPYIVDGQESLVTILYDCRLDLGVYETEFGELALQDIAAGYRMIGGGLSISPRGSWEDGSRWAGPTIPGIPSLAKTRLTFNRAEELVYWGSDW